MQETDVQRAMRETAEKYSRMADDAEAALEAYSQSGDEGDADYAEELIADIAHYRGWVAAMGYAITLTTTAMERRHNA